MTQDEPDLLRGLDASQADAVLALGAPVRLSRGAELFPLGAQADAIYLIRRGLIALTLPMQVQGREEDVLVEERRAGQTVGWSALIPPHRFTLKGTAREDSELVALPREALLDYFNAHRDVGLAVTLNLASVIGQRLQVFQAMWLREVQRSVELRLA
jgi:CRP-like cAMP-binding protein